MKRFSVHQLYLIAFCSSLMILSGCSSSSTQDSAETELLSVVVISRHGIRSPTSSVEILNQYTERSEGFPIWPPSANDPDLPENLSIVGQQNVARLGSWYRDFYADQGLLPQRGSCPAAGTVFVYADVFERTLHTAEGYREGMFFSERTPGCGIQVAHSINLQSPDPYIDTVSAGVCQIDRESDLAAFNAKTGGSAVSLIAAYSAQLQMLQAVTQFSIMDLPTEITATGPVAFASGTLFNVADTVTETFELEYAQGMPDKECATITGAQCVGWGAIPPGGLYDMTKLHVMNMQLSCSLPSFAQAGSTNLMHQLVGTMDQRLSGVKNPDMLAPVESKFTLFVAHDENLLAIAAFLGGVTWKAEGFQQNDPGPAGALVFELHRVKPRGELVVRLFYLIATLDQMRYRTTLTLNTPPQRIPLAIPACSGRYNCPYDQFKTFITAHLRQDCLVTPASKAASKTIKPGGHPF
ncbi:MAG: histidine-type phosphatase [Deltaproteobacteria bacterium]